VVSLRSKEDSPYQQTLCDNIQLLPAFKVNIIIVHPWDVVFPWAIVHPRSVVFPEAFSPKENNIPRVNNYDVHRKCGQ
jgi:hypothetical protein